MTTIQFDVKTKLIGFLFITATISSIIGLNLYAPILVDRDFVVSGSNNYARIVFGAINELVLAITATGTGIMLFPILKRYRESWGIAYLSFRIVEVVFIMIGILSVLTALSISEYYTTGVMNNKENAQNLMLSFIALHKWTFILGPNFMLAINTFLYSFVFYKTRMIPVNISKLGLLSSFFMMIASILELFGVIEQISIWGILLALPIALYEMILAVWLIVKGINHTNELR